MIRKNVAIPLTELISKLNVTVNAPSSAVVHGLAPLKEAGPHDLSFLQATRLEEASRRLSETQACAVLVADSLTSLQSDTATLIRVRDPLGSLLSLIPQFFSPSPLPEGIHATAVIDPSARIEDDVSIGPYAVIGPLVRIEAGSRLYSHVVVYPGAHIGARAVLHAGAIIREGCVIGPDCVIQNGAIIGADGFGYISDREIGLKTIPQVGNVTLAARVDVGANACIDRATLGSTRIGRSTKIDNLVQIGHNVTIGETSVVCGHTGIAGSCSIGSRVTVAGAVGIRDHTTIGDDIRIGGGSMVFGNLTERGDYLGYPAQPALEWKRQIAALRRLPTLIRQLVELLPALRMGSNKRTEPTE